MIKRAPTNVGALFEQLNQPILENIFSIISIFSF